MCHQHYVKRFEQWKSDPNLYGHAADKILEEEIQINQYFNQFHIMYLHSSYVFLQINNSVFFIGKCFFSCAIYFFLDITEWNWEPWSYVYMLWTVQYYAQFTKRDRVSVRHLLHKNLPVINIKKVKVETTARRSMHTNF